MIVDNFLRLDSTELRKREWAALFKRMQYVDAKHNLHKPWRISSKTGVVTLPRGAWSLLPDHVEYEDRRVFPKDRKYDFNVRLDATDLDERFARQSEAVASMFDEEQGQILRPPGSGKTQIMLKFIADCPTRCLVLVNTADILEQWVTYARRAIPDIPIGIIKADQEEIARLTIATVQTYNKRVSRDRNFWKNQFGCVIQDECHHSPADTFEVCLNLSAAKYRFGATASATRADGKHPYMKLVLGPVIHRMAFSSPIPVKVVPIKTKFKFAYRGMHDWHRMLDALISDDKRNFQIAEAVDDEIMDGNYVLVLSRRIEHLQRIYEKMGCQDSAEILAAALVKKDERTRILKDFKAGVIQCLLATQLADEALDVPILSRVVLTHPGKHQGRIIQQVGRALRESPGKADAIIYDVADTKARILNRQWQQRKHAYHNMKIKIRRK